jgi:hypothetical protein
MSTANTAAATPAPGAEPRETTLILRENPDGSVDFDNVPLPMGDEPAAGTPAPAPAPKPPASRDDDDEDDEGRPRDGDEAHAREDDAAASEGATDAEREAIRERRRQERRDKREKARTRDQMFRAELAARDRIIDEMRNRLDAVDRRSSGADMAAIDARIRREEGQITYLKSVIADGTKVQNGEAVAEATMQMTQKMRDLGELQRVKAQLVQTSRQPVQPQMDPRMVVNAAAWMEANTWYNPASGEADSRQVLALDQKLAEEGYNPNYPEYWEELSKRVAQALPHRAGGRPRRQELSETNSRPNGGGGAPAGEEQGYNAAVTQRRPGRSVVTGSGSDGVGATNGSRSQGTYRLSPERVAALKDAGMWDDPVARNNAIKSYREYDAKNSR